MPLSPPGFSPPKWPRLGRRRDTGLPGGSLAPLPFEIPICWFTGKVNLKLDQPFTTAAVSTDAGTYPYRNAHVANRDEYGDFPFTATLATGVLTDASNLAHWTITYRSTPRMRGPALWINLLMRSDAEKLALLRLARWSRFVITGVPAEFPEGASSLILAGMTHHIGVASRLIRITTASVIGSTPGVPGPWFRYGSSSWGSATDSIPN
jgi:hypothetical protein